jgi:hypothetical protein
MFDEASHYATFFLPAETFSPLRFRYSPHHLPLNTLAHSHTKTRYNYSLLWCFNLPVFRRTRVDEEFCIDWYHTFPELNLPWIPSVIQFCALAVISKKKKLCSMLYALSPQLFNFALEYAIRKVQENWNWMGHISFWLMLMMWICWEIT